MAQLVPHPVVAALAEGLGKGAETSFLHDYHKVRRAAAYAAAGQADADEVAQARSDLDMRAEELAKELAEDSHLPELNAFAGFLGGVLLDDRKGTSQAIWRLLYLDAKLLTWLLVKEDEIVLRSTVRDATAPFENRDVIWLKSDASLSEGSGPPQPNEVQARFLRGSFTRAGDFAATLSGGTFAPAGGLPDGIFTWGCCGRRTR
jgi:hypothetical protein